MRKRTCPDALSTTLALKASREDQLIFIVAGGRGDIQRVRMGRVMAGLRHARSYLYSPREVPACDHEPVPEFSKAPVETPRTSVMAPLSTVAPLRRLSVCLLHLKLDRAEHCTLDGVYSRFNGRTCGEQNISLEEP